VSEARLFGRPLPEGGTIGVAAPASGFENRSEVLRGVAIPDCKEIDPELRRPAAARRPEHRAACIRV
jgi:hypothetical protein